MQCQDVGISACHVGEFSYHISLYTLQGVWWGKHSLVTQRLTCIDINARGGHCGQSAGKGDLKGPLADDAGSLHGKDCHGIPARHTTALVVIKHITTITSKTVDAARFCTTKSHHIRQGQRNETIHSNIPETSSK